MRNKLSLHENLQREFSFTKNITCTFVKILHSSCVLPQVMNQSLHSLCVIPQVINQILHSSCVIPQVINQILHSLCVIPQVINQILHYSCVIPPSNKPDFNNLVYSRMQNLQAQKNYIYCHQILQRQVNHHD